MAAISGSGGKPMQKAVSSAIRRWHGPNLRVVLKPSVGATWGVFLDDAIANGMASFLGHLRRGGDSVWRRDHEVALRDVFVTIG